MANHQTRDQKHRYSRHPIYYSIYKLYIYIHIYINSSFRFSRLLEIEALMLLWTPGFFCLWYAVFFLQITFVSLQTI